MSFRWRWADRTNHVHFSYFKWPGRSCRAKMPWCLVDEVTMDLTGMTSLGVSDGVRDHLWPIIPQSSELISKLWTRLMSSTHAVMHFFEYFLCLLLWQAVEEDPIMRSTIQCSCDRIVVEFRSFPSNGGRLFGVIRRDVVQCIVDVWESPIPELWVCWSF